MSSCPRCGARYEAAVSRCADCDLPLAEQEPITAAHDPEAQENVAVVYVTTDESEAAMVSQALEAAGIANFTASEHTLLPVSIGKLGNVRVQVLQHDLDRARDVIAELAAGGPETTPDD